MPEKKTVGRELVEKSGINVETLLDLLVRNASAELTTFYYYTILRVNLKTPELKIAIISKLWCRAFTSWAGSYPTIWWISQYFRVPASKTPGQPKRHKRHARGVSEG